MALKREKDRLVHQLKQQVGRHLHTFTATEKWHYFHLFYSICSILFVLFLYVQDYSNLVLKVFKPGLKCDSSCERQEVFKVNVSVLLLFGC